MLNGARRLFQSWVRVSPKDFWMAVAISTLFMLGALALVWTHVKKIELAYEYQELAKKNRHLSRENHLLNLERESLRSLHRVSLLAKNEMKMKEPDVDRVVTIFLK